MKKNLFFVLIAAVSVIFLYIKIDAVEKLHTDAYVYLRYSENIINSGIYSFNGLSEAVMGNVSFLFPYLLAGIHSSFSNPAAALSMIGGILFLIASVFNIRRCVRSLNLWSVLAVVSAYFVFFTPLPVYFANGIETTLSLFLFTLVIYLLTADKFKPYSIPVIALISCLLYEVNAAALFFIFIFPAFLLYKNKVHLVYYYLPVILFLIADLILKNSTFGKAFPTSILSLRSVFNDELSEGLTTESVRETIKFFFYTSPLFAVMLINYKRKFLPYILVPALFILSNIYIYSMPEDKERYLLLSLPFLITGALFSLDDLKAEYFKDINFLSGLIPGSAVIFGLIIAAVVMYNRLELKLDSKGIPDYNLQEVIYLGSPERKIILPFTKDLYKVKNVNFIDFWAQHSNGDYRDHNEFFRTEKPDIIVFPSRKLYNNLEIIKEPYFRENYIYLAGIGESGIAISRINADAAKEMIETLRDKFSQFRRKAVNGGSNPPAF